MWQNGLVWQSIMWHSDTAWPSGTEYSTREIQCGARIFVQCEIILFEVQATKVKYMFIVVNGRRRSLRGRQEVEKFRFAVVCGALRGAGKNM